MRLEVLRELQILTKWMSFRKAAEELCVTQSCLSKRIAELEKELKLNLLDRDSNKVSLTPVGVAFAEEASYMVSVYDEALKRCRKIQEENARELRVQELLQNNAMVKVYSCASRYHSERHDVNVSFIQQLGGKPSEILEAGDIDIALGMQCAIPEEYIGDMAARGFRAKAIFSEPVVIWFQRDNAALAKLDRIALEDLKGVPIVTSSGKTFDYFGYAMKCLFEKHDMVPRFRSSPVGASHSMYFLADFRDGIFCATEGMLGDARLRARDDLEYRVMDDPRLTITTFMLAREDDAVACDFLDSMETAL